MHALETEDGLRAGGLYLQVSRLELDSGAWLPSRNWPRLRCSHGRKPEGLGVGLGLGLGGSEFGLVSLVD